MFKKDIAQYEDADSQLARFTILKQQEKIDRLNNIIDELEKWLISEIERINKLKNPKKGIKPYGEEEYYYENMILRYKECLDKLKKLKEGK